VSRRSRRRHRASQPNRAAPAPAAEPVRPATNQGALPQRRRAPDWVLSAGVFAVALVTRLIVARELDGTALFRHPQLDAGEFLAWARRIASGDFSLPYYPTHGLPYPLLLGALLKLGGGSLVFVRTAQAALGALTAVVLANLARIVWRSRAAAWTAGLVAALYGPLVLVDTSLWEEGLLMLFLGGALVASVARPPAPRWLLGTIAGLALGGAIAVRPTAIVVLPLAVGLLLGAQWREPAARRAGIALLAACALVVAPIVVAVSRSSGAFLFERGFGAINIWVGNDPAGGGIQNARLGGGWDGLEAEPGRAGFDHPAGVERYFLDKALARARAHPADQLKVLASKALWLLQAEEPRDNHSYYFFRGKSRLLALLPGFGVLLGLAAVGIGATWNDRRRWLWVVLYLGLTALPALVALVGLRYRLPMIIGWLLLAAPAPAALLGAWNDRRWRRLATLVLLFALIFGFAHLRRHDPSHRFGEEEAFTAASELALGEVDRAESASLRAQSAAPESSLGWDALGQVRERQGRTVEAEQLYRDAIARDPSALAPHAHLAELLLSKHQVEPALAELEALLTVNPIYQPALDRIAEIEAANGMLDRAREHWQRLATLGRGHASAWRRVGQIDGARGEFAAGIDGAREAIRLEPDRSDGWQLLGFLAVEAGDLATAREALAGLMRVDPEAGATAPVALLAAAVDYLAGDHDAADAKLRAILEKSPGARQAQALLLRNAAARGRRDEAERFLRSLPRPPAPAAQPAPN